MLDQKAHEPFDGAEDGAVNHDRTMAQAVGADVFEFEALRQAEVHLDGAELPRAAERIERHEIELRPVERRFAQTDRVFKAQLRHHLADAGLGGGPERIAARIFLRVVRIAQGNAATGLEAEDRHDFLHEAQAGFELVLELFGRAEDVAVVLGEAAHAHEAVEFARLFLTVNGAELGVALRQVAVAARLRRVGHEVHRAVHGFEQKLPLLDADGFIHALRVVGIVAGGFIEVDGADVRRVEPLVAVVHEFGGDEFFQLCTDDRALGQEQGQAAADGGIDAEEFQLRTQLAMVAPRRFGEGSEMRFQLRRRGERRAVDALELALFLVATMVGAGEGEQFERADLARACDVRARAQVGEIAVGIERDCFAFWDVAEAAELKGLTARRKQRLRLGARHLPAHESLILRDYPRHLRFNGRKVFHREPVGAAEIVIKTGFGGRSDIKESLWIKARYGRAEHMRGGVTEFLDGSYGHENVS